MRDVAFYVEVNAGTNGKGPGTSFSSRIKDKTFFPDSEPVPTRKG